MLADTLFNSMNTTAAPAPRPGRKRNLGVDAPQLRQFLCTQGYSLRRAAQALGVCTDTARVAAARLGIAVDARPKKITTTVSDAVLQALGRGVAPKDIAAAIDISLPSVYSLLRMHPDVAERHKQKSLEHKALLRRERFLLQRATTPSASCADYYWLRRNDQAWLQRCLAPRDGAR